MFFTNRIVYHAFLLLWIVSLGVIIVREEWDAFPGALMSLSLLGAINELHREIKRLKGEQEDV